jgi:exopolysaccharide biosynthesis polyprenyl glycosylphosphotransferase
MFRRFSLNFAIFSMVVDAGVVALMLYFAAAVRPHLDPLPFIAQLGPSASTPLVLYAVLPVGWVGILASFALYDGKKHIRAVDEFTALSLASVLAGISLAGILYFSFRDVSRAQFLLFVILSYAGLVTWRAVARLIFRVRRLNKQTEPRRILIVGTGPIGRMVEERLKNAADYDLFLAGFIDDGPAEAFSGTLVGSLAELRVKVEQLAISDVIIALPPHFYESMRAAVACLDEVPVRVWIALGFYDLALYRTATEDFAGLPLLDLRASALDDYERMVKRAFDLACGSLALLAVSPILVFIALLIWIRDGRPILFRQKRVGENGQLFDMLKFRTMVRNAEELAPLVQTVDDAGNLIHKAKGDPRVTRLGRLLRRYSLDELPQLLNVLRGEMSLVGPRPELPALVGRYQPWQRQRLAVPPGITGWWQVTGRSDKVMHLHTEDDLYYVQNYSIWLDLRIIMRTVWVVLLGRGAY